MRSFLTLLVSAVCIGRIGGATRLKELVSIEGVRDNQLVGYGVVVGLNGTGDKRQTVFSAAPRPVCFWARPLCFWARPRFGPGRTH